MIEVASWPKDLSHWNPRDPAHPYYLELFGETSPRLDRGYGGPIASDAAEADPTLTKAYTYEYWWTIGHGGYMIRHHHWYDHVNPMVSDAADPDEDEYVMWTHLREPAPGVAARVYLFFPRGGGWRIKEIAAAVNYLTPVRNHASWMEQIGQDWKTVQPVVDTASQLASAAAGAAVAGPVGGFSTAWATERLVDQLSAVATMQLNSVPQTKLDWAVAKMTTHASDAGGVAQGVAWTLPKAMFEELGGRITGSIAVSLIPAPLQQGEEVATGSPVLEKLPILAHSVIYAQDENGSEGEYWSPAQNRFVKLFVQPH